MMRTRSLPLALLLALGAPIAHADDLMQIYQQARASDPTLAGAEATKLATDENVDQARSQLLPQIAAALSFTRATGGSNTAGFVPDPVTGQNELVLGTSTTFYTRSLGATLDQSLVDISRWTALKSSELTANAGAATYDAAQQALLISTAQTYFNVLTALDALKFADANEKALNRQLEQAQQRFEVGLAAITDVNDAKAQHDAAVANVISAQNTVDQSREAVRQLTNKEPGEFKKLREDLPLDHPNPDDPKVWVDLALKQNPVLTSSAFQVDAANQNINTARAGHLPVLNAQLGYARAPSWGDTDFSGGQTFHDSSDPKWGGSIGVTLSVPIFSGGFTQSRVRQAIYNRDFAAGSVRIQPPPGRSRDAQQLPLGDRRRERSRGDQGGCRVGAKLGRSDAGRLRSRHAHDRRRADQPADAAAGAIELLAGAPHIRSRWSAAQAGRRRHRGQGPAADQRAARMIGA